MTKDRVDDLRAVAIEILRRHAYPTESVEYLGRGEQSVCYGAGDVVLLINQVVEISDVRQVNPYPLQQWMTAQAVRAGVKTAEIQALGDRPLPYALMRRAHGISAEASKETTQGHIAEWFRWMGAEVRTINGIPTEGFGEYIPSGNDGYCGRYATWGAYLDACIAKYAFCGPLSQEAQSVHDLVLAQGILSGIELDKVASRLNAAKEWDTQPVLVHYDNRLANLVVNGEERTLLDWGLSYAGIGLPQELIKVTEAPAASPEHSPMTAFLEGYGLAQEAWAEAIERATLMLVLDGLAMSYSWAVADEPTYLGGIRSWLHSIKRICDRW